MATERVVKTVCGFCHTNCGMEIHLKEGIIDKIKGNPEHPVNKGALCPKGPAIKELVYSPSRLKYPLRKTPSGFQQISWDEALDQIASKLMEIKNKYGPQTLLRYSGAPVTEENRDGFVQFLASYGSPNYMAPGHLCSVPRRLALELVYGERTDPDYENTNCILIWGSNPTASMQVAERMAYGRFDKVIQEAKRRGAQLIVIDPRCTELAGMADEFLQINPGTDAALGLAMLNVIINEGIYDKEFVAKWTIGFEDLAKHVQAATPEWAEKITWVPADKIRKTARIYATTKPSSIREGNGLDQHTNVVDTVRLTGILTAITGNLDVPGGNVFLPMPKVAPCPSFRPQENPLGADKYPLYPRAPFPAVVDAILTGEPYQPRAMIVYHGNPLLINANEARIRRALEKLKFLVVYDIFLSATAELADIVLPDASDFERFGYQVYSSAKGGVVALRQKVIEPVGESRQVFEVEYELAQRLGLAQSYPWKTTEEWIDYKLRPSGISLEDLKRQPVTHVTAPLEYRKYLNNGFGTPSKKVEFFSGRLKDHGYGPLPMYRDPAGGLGDQYPLIGTTRRPGVYVHTRFRNLPMLHKKQPDPMVRLNSQDAQPRGIEDGNWTVVDSPQGRIQVKAKVTPEVQPGLVIIDFGWGNPWDNGPNVNILTSDDERDPVCSTTPNRRFVCELKKA